MIFPKNNEEIKATYVADKKTKRLLTRIKANQVAVLVHTDIDEVAALEIIEKKISAVINFSKSLTGKYPTLGLKRLLEAKIPVFDVLSEHEIFPKLRDGNLVIVNKENKTVQFPDDDNPKIILPVKEWTMEKLEYFLELAYQNLERELDNFITNTLEYASKEKNIVLQPLKIPELNTKFTGHHVVVVVRGNNYRNDLYAIRPYIKDYRPVLIGVDGGADALIEYGFVPDIIIGDMDSVSDEALKSGAEIVVHAYPHGKAPGLSRVKNLGLDAKVIPSVGTSEDVALLMAYEEGAEMIVAIGSHSNVIDFLEKGRKGMASTLLVRMKIGSKLIDAKGVSTLYRQIVYF
ncbi:hypothetical protein BHF71_04895 [Vulcanibacillus modesticaldus]|uniref:Thiamin pyrophosphokinase catalytic domain-containing protein n=1 Tax=Vulcanibacillus modesticaldus TaxID=337097 RepID=A0A1D2YRV1_9BACI|nr:putative cytokinetic ring protein SteA [Vulcanibacillus modesticaldus]OEF95531.1 hypothetical protein BHF71_04895 [Vulcanibacillus modesticaldus]